MEGLFRSLVYIKEQAEFLGIADQLNIVITTDFGRTPHYNRPELSTSGKDHHSVGAYLTMLWGSQVEDGVRQIGKTDDGVRAFELDENLRPVDSGQGVKLTPAIVHGEWRRIAGLKEGTIADAFDLSAPRLPLYG